MATQHRKRPAPTPAPRRARRPVRAQQAPAQRASQPRHARATPAPAAAAANRQAAQAQQGQPPAAQRKPIGVREAAGKGTAAAAAVTQRQGYSGKRMLTAELIAGVLIVAVRSVADYEPQADGTIKGKIGHPKGQYGPLPILAGLIMSFFLLSFLAASGGTKAKLAVIAGGVIDLALLMKSADQFNKVAETFGGNLGKAKRPAGDWQTSGTAFGSPIAGTDTSGGGSSSGNSGGGGNVGTSPGFETWLKTHPGGTLKQYLETHPGSGVIGPTLPA